MRRAARAAGSEMCAPRSITGSCGAIGATNCLPKKKATPLPKMIIAMPAAMSFTPGNSVTRACSKPNRVPASAAATKPSHGDPVRSETAKALMAPMSRIPSMPKLIRPLFSVKHSPKLTKMYGILPRTAPPSREIAMAATSTDALATGGSRIPRKG